VIQLGYDDATFALRFIDQDGFAARRDGPPASPGWCGAPRPSLAAPTSDPPAPPPLLALTPACAMARPATVARSADDDPRRPDAVTPFVLIPVPLEQADTTAEVYALLCFFSGLLCFLFHVRCVCEGGFCSACTASITWTGRRDGCGDVRCIAA